MGKKLWKRSAAVVLMLVVLSTGLVANAQGTYTVEKGDYLKKIAQSVYGDSARWEDIYEANKETVRNPNILYKGQVLILPDVLPDPALSPEAESVPTENTEEIVTVGTAATMEEWIRSEECIFVVQFINEILKDAGLTTVLKADGNTLVFEYIFIPEIWGEMTTEEMLAAFGGSELDAFIESQRNVFEQLAQDFDDTYGIQLDGVRYIFIAPDGTPFYTAELKNE